MRQEGPLSRTTPGETTGIGPIPSLPIFFKLGDRAVLLAGGALPAVWKAELLAATGARVVVCDPSPCPEMTALADGAAGAVEIRHRSWQSGDFEGAALAIGALDGEHAEAFRRAAHAAGVPVNIVDKPGLCDFQFGAIIARNPLLIAISTDGATPVLGQALRARIEALLPDTLGAWVVAAQQWRVDVQRRELGFAARRRFWERFTDRALDGTGRLPGEEDRAACLEAALDVQASERGALVLVGSGPGPADLVTLRAVRALQSADVIVYDRSVDPAIVGLGRREASRVVEPGQDRDTADLIAGHVANGKRVALLAPGTPSRCGRWEQRSSALAARRLHGMAVEGLMCPACPRGCAAAGAQDAQ